MKTILGIFCILITFTTGNALHCYRCSYSKLGSSNPLLQTVLKVFQSLSDQTCLLQETGDLYEIAIRECPPPDKAGYVYKCATIDGMVTTSFSFISFSYRSMERDCLQVPVSEADYTDGCHTDLPGSGPARGLLEQGFTGLDLGDITFDGTVCYETKSIDYNGLLCPRCTYNELEAGQRAVDTVLNLFNKISNDDCQLLVKASRYKIDYRNCRDPAPGHINKCGEVRGTVTAKLGTEFRYNTLDRDCVTGRPDDSSFTDGCHDDVDSKGPAGALIEQTYEGLSLGDMKFSGKACYQPDAETFISAASPLFNIISTLFLVLVVCLLHFC